MHSKLSKNGVEEKGTTFVKQTDPNSILENYQSFYDCFKLGRTSKSCKQ